MWIICQADDSHEMSRLVFSEKKKKKKKKKMSSAAVVTGTLRVQYILQYLIIDYISEKERPLICH